ncbi:MAG: ATP-dependent carboxylate-amine ligase [Caulobacter sp.]|nr:ATP-dependent carboxylate-amine ligase [Caulobacter sp.]
MKRVLITGARAPIAIDLARSFAAAGWEPHLADSVRPWSARLAPVADGRLHRHAPPRFAFARFRADLKALVTRLDPQVILPICEEVFYVAEAAARDGFADRVLAPPPEMLRRLHSKVEFAALAREAGLDAPATHRLRSLEDLQAWRSKARQLVFKPEFSRFASRALIRPAPGRLAITPTPEAPWAVQAYEGGEEVCIWSFARAGRLTAFAAYRPSWRLGRSASFYFETDSDPALLAFAQRLAAVTGATGQLAYDVVRRPDGSIAPLECNPRGVSGVHLFDAAPRLAEALVGDTALQCPEAAARHLAPAMWLMGAPQALLQGRLSAFRTDLARSRDVFAISGTPGRAILGALLDAGRFTMVGLSRGRSASGQSTDDIEWNGEVMG